MYRCSLCFIVSGSFPSGVARVSYEFESLMQRQRQCRAEQTKRISEGSGKGKGRGKKSNVTEKKSIAFNLSGRK